LCIFPPPEPHCPCFTYQEGAAIAETQSSSSKFHCFNGPAGGLVLWQSIQSTVGIPWEVEANAENRILNQAYEDILAAVFATCPLN
jgi:hypothetical protein